MSRRVLHLAFILGCCPGLIGGIAPTAAAPFRPFTPVTLPAEAHARANADRATAVPAPAQAANLVQDGGFEQQGAGWEACGNVRLVDAESAGAGAVYSGRYAAFMGAGADSSSCPRLPDNTTPRQLLRQELSIPASAGAVTVSFWFRAEAGTGVDVFLARGLYQFDPDLGGVKLGSFATDQPPGWQLYRTVLTGDQLERVRGQRLWFSIVIQENTAVDPEAVLLIDEVQVLAADGRTSASPLPPALRGTGSRPLAAIRAEAGGNHWLYRMDPDGSNQQLIYRGLLNNVRYPAWSPDGWRLAVADYNTWPWPTPDPDPQNNLSAAAVTVLNADGSEPQSIYQTQSRKGSRCPFLPGPGQREEPSQIVRVSTLDWMPDNRRVVFTNVGFNAFCDGRISGGLADLLLSPEPGGLTAPRLAFSASNPSINRNGQVLFDGFTVGNSRAAGVWELDTSVQPAREVRLLPNPADREPVWAPDGQRFAVVRVTTSPSADTSERTFAIMLYNRQDLANPRMLLFADHGRNIGRVRWSPDGAYLVYTLGRFDGGSDIWWLAVATGATGPVTSDGAWLEAAWRPVSQSQVFLPVLVHN
ncbi:MAG: WD40 repeat domain-containing protein [Chloroflexaceae bacterium]